MCYGCCCGVAAVDVRHRPRREPLDRIRTAMEVRLREGGLGDVRIQKTGCLGPCSKGNMVVVHRPGVEAHVFQGVNNQRVGVDVADFAMDMERRGWGSEVPASLDPHVYGTVAADEVPPPPSPEPYKDRH